MLSFSPFRLQSETRKLVLGVVEAAFHSWGLTHEGVRDWRSTVILYIKDLATRKLLRFNQGDTNYLNRE